MTPAPRWGAVEGGPAAHGFAVGKITRAPPGPGTATPEKMLGHLKAWCTRRLRENGVVAGDRKVWTDGGRTRYLWNAADLADAVDYVANQQGPRLPRE